MGMMVRRSWSRREGCDEAHVQNAGRLEDDRGDGNRPPERHHHRPQLYRRFRLRCCNTNELDWCNIIMIRP